MPKPLSSYFLLLLPERRDKRYQQDFVARTPLSSPLAKGGKRGGRRMHNKRECSSMRGGFMTTAKQQCAFVIAVLSTVLTSLLGCSQYIDPRVPEPIRPIVEPESGHGYLLYRPSSYDSNLAWPLVVVCPGSSPDSPNRQIRAWTELAESHGFLVAAPTLTVTKRGLSRDAAKYLARQRHDEAHILAVVRHVRGAHRISPDRVFIYGWSAGAYAALYTGLRHPHLFRAISIVQPRFKSLYLGDAEADVDPYQPVHLHYSSTDAITGKNGRHCVDWLHSVGADVREEPPAPVRRTDCGPAVSFFQHLIRREPWIRVRALPAAGRDSLAVQFKLRCPFRPTRFRWQFGDGDESSVAEPLHIYPESGTYRVSVALHAPDHTPYLRTIDLTVP